jgi:hypothetical protein
MHSVTCICMVSLTDRQLRPRSFHPFGSAARTCSMPTVRMNQRETMAAERLLIVTASARCQLQCFVNVIVADCEQKIFYFGLCSSHF